MLQNLLFAGAYSFTDIALVTRIFLVLALVAILSMAAALLVGLSLGDLRNDLSPTTQGWARVHRLSGVAAGLVVVLVNSISVTYFIGTSRWVKEVAETYHLDRELIRRSTALKRRTFPWAVSAMLVVVGIIALGGAADPGALGPDVSTRWTMPHLVGAMLGIVFVAWSLIVQWNNIFANHQLIGEVMEHVRRIRTERGLETAGGAG